MVFFGKKMVVIGGGITGMETALYLKAQGNDVTIVDFAPMFPLVNNALLGGSRKILKISAVLSVCRTVIISRSEIHAGFNAIHLMSAGRILHIILALCVARRIGSGVGAAILIVEQRCGC